VRFASGGWKGFVRVEDMVWELENVWTGRWARAEDDREGGAREGISAGGNDKGGDGDILLPRLAMVVKATHAHTQTKIDRNFVVTYLFK